MPPAPPPPPGQTVPYDHLFKILMIGDAGVGKVSQMKRSPQLVDIIESCEILYTWRIPIPS
eukprot:scaffold421188_cov47-Attheya_sp.AAC.9